MTRAQTLDKQKLIDSLQILSAKVTLWSHGVHDISSDELQLFMDLVTWYETEGRFIADARRARSEHEHDFRVQCSCGASPDASTLYKSSLTW